MSFECQCINCKQKFEAEDNWEGQTCTCPNCNQEIILRKPKPPPLNNTSRNNLGETSLPKTAKILGFVAIFTGITAIPAVICGHLGLDKLNKGYKGKKKDALIGLIIGYILIVFMFIGLVSNSIDENQEKAEKESLAKQAKIEKERLAKQTKIKKEKLAKQTKIEKEELKIILVKANNFLSEGNIDKAIKKLGKIHSLKHVDRTEGLKLLNDCNLIKSPDCVEKYLTLLSTKELQGFHKKKGKSKETYLKNTFLDTKFKEKLDKNLTDYLSLAKKMVYKRLKEEEELKKIFSKKTKSTFDDEFLKRDAWNISKVFVKRRLNITSTAKFPWDKTDKVKYIGKKRFQVRSYVDVTNYNNETSQMNYTCVVEREGKSWRKISLDMGEIYKQERQKELIRAQKEFEKRKPELDQLARIIYGSRYINEKRKSAIKALLTVAGIIKDSPKGATKYRFDALRIGISYHEAVMVMGTYGTKLSSSHSGSSRSEYYQWEAPRGYGAGSMNVMFRNGKLVSKTQYRLE